MKLVYVKWKHVKAFLGSIDKPVSKVFRIIIRSKWLDCPGPQPGRWVYEVEIPEEMIT